MPLSHMKPTGALAEMLAREGVLDQQFERGLVFDSPPPEPAPPWPPPIYIPPPDWREEERERLERQAAPEPEEEPIVELDTPQDDAPQAEEPRPRGRRARHPLRRARRRAWQP